ncbi:hypothetical protein [Rhodococcoides kyotonense]|uniref:Uncharacterized protein n=1 Tax=Rhodococcoides kyotonense TaxID=398843 RepID=A0A239H0N8_9NOCA|nr:hypothetical protein [Rhodococcus kyotonensis]SNS74731.1 hypothetical protein SAMN05421642_10527 [Rhodococcus kyotonensis]
MYSPVTHIDSHAAVDETSEQQRAREEAAAEFRDEVSALAAHIEATVERNTTPFWFPGWQGEIEAALLDSVFSARATYGTERNGVRRVITRWREHRATDLLDDLSFLAQFVDDPDNLADILGNRQRVAGNSTTKAEAAAKAAAALMEVGVDRSADLADASSRQFMDQADAFTSIAGIGAKTWRCMMFVVGIRDQDMSPLVAFVSGAIGEEVDECGTHELMHAAARELGSDLATVEHALWRVLRRPPPRKKKSA